MLLALSKAKIREHIKGVEAAALTASFLQILEAFFSVRVVGLALLLVA